MQPLGRIICNRHEEIWILLKEVCQKWYVELRPYAQSGNGTSQFRPGRDVINLPVEQIPLLLEQLTHTKDLCVKQGLLQLPSPNETVTMHKGVPVVKGGLSAAGQPVRRHPRLSVRYPVVCQLLANGQSQHRDLVRAEIRDISLGGAQIWLPCRLELLQRIEVSGMIDGQPFRARAEIVGADLRSNRDPKTGHVRHNLRWLEYNPGAKEILERAFAPASKPSPVAAGLPAQR